MDYNSLVHSLAGIEKINTTLTETKGNLPQSRIDKIVANAGELLQHIETHANEGFNPLTEKLRANISGALKVLHENLTLHTKLGYQEEGIKLYERIEKIEKAVEVSPVFRKKVIPRPPLNIVPIAFFSDFSLWDHNGAIASKICNAIEQEIPFITSLSMLKLIGTEDGIPRREEMRTKLREHQDKFEIYEKNGMLVFIPKSLPSKITDEPYITPEERLKALDFKTDGTENEKLKPISAENALTMSRDASKISDVVKLFSEEPKANKLFYICGHGDADTMASMNEIEYRQFSKFLENQNCKGLIVFSCDSAGKSSQFNVPQLASPERASFLDQVKPNIPTLVQSIGDFPTYVDQPAEANLKGFLNTYIKFLEGSKQQTAAQLGIQVNTFEEGKEKTNENLIRFYPALPAGVPGGFEPIHEKGIKDSSISLTYTKVRVAELSSRNVEPIMINGAKRLEVHPLVTQVPLQFVSNNPILLSMIPGNGHHFFKEIKLSNSFATPEELLSGAPIDFIIATLKFHLENEINANKGFFISEISSPFGALNDVVISVSPAGASCHYRKGERYYTIDNQNDYKPKLISSIEHAIQSEKIVNTTEPSEKAVRMTSAGRESDADFMEAIKDAYFFNPIYDQLFDRTKRPVQILSDFDVIIKKMPETQRAESLTFLFKNIHDSKISDKIFELIVAGDFTIPEDIFLIPKFWGILNTKFGDKSMIDRVLKEFDYLIHSNPSFIDKIKDLPLRQRVEIIPTFLKYIQRLYPLNKLLKFMIDKDYVISTEIFHDPKFWDIFNRNRHLMTKSAMDKVINDFKKSSVIISENLFREIHQIGNLELTEIAQEKYNVIYEQQLELFKSILAPQPPKLPENEVDDMLKWLQDSENTNQNAILAPQPPKLPENEVDDMLKWLQDSENPTQNENTDQSQVS
jgi:hypothetical protein